MEGAAQTKKVVVISSLDNEKRAPRESVHRSLYSSLRSADSSLQQIYINIASCYTVAGILDAIIWKAKKFDSSILPLIWFESTDSISAKSSGVNTGEGSEYPRDQVAKKDRVKSMAVRRIVQILNRSRILLVLDGLECFMSRPINHHGVVEFNRDRMDVYCDFIDSLFTNFERESNKNGSLILATVNRPTDRRGCDHEQSNEFEKECKPLESGNGCHLDTDLRTEETKEFEKRLQSILLAVKSSMPHLDFARKRFTLTHANYSSIR